MCYAVLVYGFAAPKPTRIDLDNVKGIEEYAGEIRREHGINLIYGVKIDLKYYKKLSFEHVDILAESLGCKADYCLAISGSYDFDPNGNEFLFFDEKAIQKASEALEKIKVEIEKMDLDLFELLDCLSF